MNEETKRLLMELQVELAYVLKYHDALLMRPLSEEKLAELPPTHIADLGKFRILFRFKSDADNHKKYL